MIYNRKHRAETLRYTYDATALDKRMSKKAKKRRDDPKKVAKEAEMAPEMPRAVPGIDVDFGGLPQRDLKKNLGCG
jgi:hypothetical protein